VPPLSNAIHKSEVTVPKIEFFNPKAINPESPNSKIQDPRTENFEFQDILRLPHFHAPNKPFLSSEKRAAQFMPFKSLDVYEDTIEKKFQILEDQSIDPIVDYSDNQENDLFCEL